MLYLFIFCDRQAVSFNCMCRQEVQFTNVSFQKSVCGMYISQNIRYNLLERVVVLPVFEWLLSQSCCGWRWPHTKQWEKMHQN
jgi:hypothetical protein